MRNYRLGSAMGIPVDVNVTLLLFLPFLAWLITRPDQLAAYADAIATISPHAVDVSVLQSGSTIYVVGVGSAVGLFAGVLLHELGHAWMARRYEVGISSITLWIFGGMAHMEELPERWSVEFWIAVAGPVTSVLLGGVFYALLQVMPAISSAAVFVVGWLAVVNVTLAVFNLVPAFPMDGGRVLRALLARRRPYVEATQTAATVAKALAILMAVVGALALAPMLVLISLFVFVAAAGESKATVIRELLKGVTVGDLVDGPVPSVEAEATVADLLERMVSERRVAYAVVEADERLHGVVTLQNVRDVPQVERADTAVGDVMSRDPPTVDADADAFELLTALAEHDADTLPVTRDGVVVGLVSQADLVRALEIIEGLGGRGDPDVTPTGYP